MAIGLAAKKKGGNCVHIVYIEFGISKSNQYKKACNLAKQIPNYKFSDGITQCYIDDIKDLFQQENEIYAFNIKVDCFEEQRMELLMKQLKEETKSYIFSTGNSPCP